MSQDIFRRFAPFIQDFIYQSNWSELRDVQIAAADVIFNTDNNLLLAANTAAGKTEAAFFPILTLLTEDPPASLGALYIGPLKALINDQFLRLEDICRDAGIAVSRWHGDVSHLSKNRLISRPSGILQITPESLEALLMRRHNAIPRLFSDLRFIVIDEVHALLRGDRGGQTLSCLERLSRIAKVRPRRVALSATVGDPCAMGTYLSSGTGRITSIPSFEPPVTRWRLSVEHFRKPSQSQQKRGMDANGAESERRPDPGLEFIFEHSRGRKCLIFSNSREECELVTSGLRQICAERNEPDRFLIHHGNLSTTYRQMAETAMRDEAELRSTVTTATLELGIDIGRLERAFQLDAPWSVSSFLQRLGRTGRRGSPPEMCFVVSEIPPGETARLPELIPWKLVQAVAVIELYRKERWVEPPRMNPAPYSLLYHQTVSTIAAEGELTPSQLAARILTLSPFASVTEEDFRLLLLHLLKEDIFTRTETGGIILGEKGEKQSGFYKFYAVFQESEEFTVRCENVTLGTIARPPAMGEMIAIAGHVWHVDDIDYKRHLIRCTMVEGEVMPYFGQCAGETHGRILEYMRDVLTAHHNYPYLMPNARERLKEARELAQNAGICERPLIRLDQDQFCLFPWLGTLAFQTLERFLKKRCARLLGLGQLEAARPYYLRFRMGARKEDFYRVLIESSRSGIEAMSLLSPTERPLNGKYDEYLPTALARKGFAASALDPVALLERIEDWKAFCSVPLSQLIAIHN